MFFKVFTFTIRTFNGTVTLKYFRTAVLNLSASFARTFMQHRDRTCQVSPVNIKGL